MAVFGGTFKAFCTGETLRICASEAVVNKKTKSKEMARRIERRVGVIMSLPLHLNHSSNCPDLAARRLSL
jgi:hypothetical protein